MQGSFGKSPNAGQWHRRRLVLLQKFVHLGDVLSGAPHEVEPVQGGGGVLAGSD